MFGWLLVGGWLGNFYCKIETNNWTDWLVLISWLTVGMAGGSPPCLAGRWLVNWYWLVGGKETDRMLADCWLVGWLGVAWWNSKSRLKWLTCLDWLTGGSLSWSLLSWSVVGWLVLAKRLTECGWLLVGGWLGALWRQNRDSNDWLGCFLWRQNRDSNDWVVLTDYMAGGSPPCLETLDWLHGWRLPSLLSWSVVGWLVLAKRLT